MLLLPHPAKQQSGEKRGRLPPPTKKRRWNKQFQREKEEEEWETRERKRKQARQLAKKNKKKKRSVPLQI